MGQCGSTLLYNIVRLLYKLTDKPLKSGYITSMENTPDIEEGYVVIKQHELQESNVKNYKFIIMAVRDPRDSCVSGIERNQSKFHDFLMDRNYRMYKSVVPYATHTFKYENYKDNQLEEVKN